VAGIPAARVVAVIAKLDTGKTQIGSGYLLDATHVLTALHCSLDKETGRSATGLSVIRASDGATAAVNVSEASPTLDLALLALNPDSPWDAELPGGPVVFGKVNRERTAQLNDCEAVGYPLWQGSEAGDYRDVAELYGHVRALEGMESQRLVLRDPILAGTGWALARIDAADAIDAAVAGRSAWGGLSGAAVFHSGLLLGVIIEHHPRQGETALQIRPIEAIATATDDATIRLGTALGISRPGAFRYIATERPRVSTDEDARPAENAHNTSASRDAYAAARDLSVHNGPTTHIDKGTEFSLNIEEVILQLGDPSHVIAKFREILDGALKPVPPPDATVRQLVAVSEQHMPRPGESPFVQQVIEAVSKEASALSLEEPSGAAHRGPAGESCLAVILQKDYYADLYRMFVVLYRDGRDGVPQECNDDFVSLGEIQARVRSLLPLLSRGLGMVLVEFAVPESLLGADFDQWPLASHPGAPIETDFRLGEKHPVVVRDLDRMKPDWDMWQSRWRRLLGCDGPAHEAVYWVMPQSTTRFKPLRAMLLDPETAGQVVLALRPTQVPVKIVDHMIRAAVAAGVPAAIWMRRPHAARASIEEDRDYLEKALVEGALSSLPYRVRTLRLRAAQEQGKAAHPGRRLSLLWADPDRYWDPPPFEQPALSANGDDL
jgi:hypothetical protein